MAGTRTSSRVSARGSPRSSPRSAPSPTRSARSVRSGRGADTPTAKTGTKRGTPLKQVTTPQKTNSGRAARSSGVKGKTSPYFSRRGKVKDDDVDEEDDGDEEEEEEHNPKYDATGLTSSESGSDSERSEDAFDPPSSGDEEADPEELDESENEEEVDSDFLDDDAPKKSSKKRKSTGGWTVEGSSKASKVKNGTSASGAGSGGKKPKSERKTNGGNGNGHEPIEGYEDEEFDSDEYDLEEGQQIAGRIYPAPKGGQVPPGMISQNTLNFLKNMQIPERNDREWFRSHEPAFRQAEKEWKTFVGIVQTKFHEADEEVPILPPKDVIHRIYRDVRFSSDKTPYKKSFSLTTSRGGRKGIWACYHLSISPNDRSILACGIWMPGKNELASIRHSFKTDPQQFRDVIGAPEFVKLFGPAKPGKGGKRQNVFGHDDALKVAPKGVEKDHKDIDLLKLRSVSVVHHFTDEEVLSKGFQEEVKRVVAVMSPFVHLLNDMVTLPVPTDDA